MFRLSQHKYLLPNDKSLKGFQDSFLQILNPLTSWKTTFVLLNQAYFMNKEAIKKRSDQI